MIRLLPNIQNNFAQVVTSRILDKHIKDGGMHNFYRQNDKVCNKVLKLVNLSFLNKSSLILYCHFRLQSKYKNLPTSGSEPCFVFQ